MDKRWGVWKKLYALTLNVIVCQASMDFFVQQCKPLYKTNVWNKGSCYHLGISFEEWIKGEEFERSCMH